MFNVDKILDSDKNASHTIVLTFSLILTTLSFGCGEGPKEGNFNTYNTYNTYNNDMAKEPVERLNEQVEEMQGSQDAGVNEQVEEMQDSQDAGVERLSLSERIHNYKQAVFSAIGDSRLATDFRWVIFSDLNDLDQSHLYTGEYGVYCHDTNLYANHQRTNFDTLYRESGISFPSYAMESDLIFHLSAEAFIREVVRVKQYILAPYSAHAASDGHFPMTGEMLELINRVTIETQDLVPSPTVQCTP